MKMVNLKAEPHDDMCCAMPMEQYGYGLRLYLNEEACEKLGIAKALRAGTEVTLSCNALVASATESLERPGDHKGSGVSLSLQITDMGLDVGSVRRDAAAELYGKD